MEYFKALVWVTAFTIGVMCAAITIIVVVSIFIGFVVGLLA